MRHDHESIAGQAAELPGSGTAARHDADYVFYELARSICPICRTTIDAQIVLRHEKVFMRKRCPEHGQFEALVYADAQAYTSQSRFNSQAPSPWLIAAGSSTAVRTIAGCAPTTSNTPAATEIHGFLHVLGRAPRSSADKPLFGTGRSRPNFL